MAAEESLPRAAVETRTAGTSTGVYAEGLLAGLAGAATIAAWFLVLDVARGRPFHTPTVLGTAFFAGGRGLDGPLAPSLEVVLFFTWVHVLVFLVIGVAASRLLAIAERDPSFGFGIVLLLVGMEVAFLAACMLFADTVLQVVAWPEVLVGNVLAAAVMATVFWRRHPRLVIRP